jgi:hypothetical protein
MGAKRQANVESAAGETAANVKEYEHGRIPRLTGANLSGYLFSFNPLLGNFLNR